MGRGATVRGGRTAAGALTAALVLVGCSAAPGTAPATGSASTDHATGSTASNAGTLDTAPYLTDAEAADLAEALGTALSAGDEEAWLAHFELDDAGLTQQRDAFRTVQALPMTLREMHATTLVSNPMRAVGTEAKVGLAFRHQITGVDPVPVASTLVATVVRGDDGVLRISALAPAARENGYPRLWDLTPTTVLRTGHAIVLAPTGIGDEVDALLPSIEVAASAAMKDFPVDGVDALLVEIADDAEFSTLNDDEVAPDGLSFLHRLSWVAQSDTVTGAALKRVETAGPGSVRFVVSWPYAVSDATAYPGSPGGLSAIRSGVASAWQTYHQRDDLPAWMLGFGRWYELERDPAKLADEGQSFTTLLAGTEPPTELLRSDRFASEDDIPPVLAQTTLVWYYIDETYGADAGVDLIKAAYAHDGWVNDEVVDDLVSEHLGVGVAELEAGWVQWLTERFYD